MRLKHLLAWLVLAALVLVVRAQGQPAVDTTRVPQWYDPASGTTHLVSSQYPLPLRPPSEAHTTLTNIVLANGVAQVVIAAGSITNGCDITFSNSFGNFFVAWTDPGAPTVPTAAAPAGYGNVTTGVGRGLQLQNGSGYSISSGYVYHCPGPSAQGVSVLYAANYNGQSSPPVPTAIVSVDVY